MSKRNVNHSGTDSNEGGGGRVAVILREAEGIEAKDSRRNPEKNGYEQVLETGKEELSRPFDGIEEVIGKKLARSMPLLAFSGGGHWTGLD